MAKTAIINVRIDPKVKADVEQLFSSFGISVSDAVNIFLYKSLMEGGFPFEVKQSGHSAVIGNTKKEDRAIADRNTSEQK